MKDVVLVLVAVIAANFLFSGDPSLYELLHKQAIEKAGGRP
jgi:hypothetical protein